MESLTDIYQSLSGRDAELLEKQAEEIKVAEEQEFAGRITARGFADELNKLAEEEGWVSQVRQKAGNAYDSAMSAAKSKAHDLLSSRVKGIAQQNMAPVSAMTRQMKTPATPAVAPVNAMTRQMKTPTTPAVATPKPAATPGPQASQPGTGKGRAFLDD